MRALGPAAAFRASIDLLQRRPFPALALGLALYTSLASVCCGFGVVAAPWFACELLSLLLGAGLGHSLLRTRSWLWAGLIQMFTVIVLTSVALIALMSFGVAGLGQTAPRVGEALPLQVGQGLFVGASAGALVLSITVYFEYAPSILIERGGGFTAALLESARIVALHGAARTWLTSALARGLPLLGAVLVLGLLALRASLSATLAFVLLLLPLLVLLLLIGQGMLAASYLHVRAEVTDPARVPFGGEPSKRGTALWTILLSCVALGPVLVSSSLLKPSMPRVGGVPAELAVLAETDAGPQARTLYVPHTALSLVVSQSDVRVVASDGGGAGSIPLPRQAVVHVRVVAMPLPALQRAPRGESTLAIALRLADGRELTTWIDEAGVRLDDTWERRLALRLSPWEALSLVICFAWTALWIARSLPPQARIRRKLSSQRAHHHPDLEHEQRLRTALRARVLQASLWLLPPALGSIAIGLSALLG